MLGRGHSEVGRDAGKSQASTILKGDLRTFHGTAIVKSQQAAIADGHPMNIGSQILEGGLTIAKGRFFRSYSEVLR
jgi:hypothetical protein